MALGMVHANISRKGEALFKAVERFTPPVLTFFFVVSGMRLNVPALKMCIRDRRMAIPRPSAW